MYTACFALGAATASLALLVATRLERKRSLRRLKQEFEGEELAFDAFPVNPTLDTAGALAGAAGSSASSDAHPAKRGETLADDNTLTREQLARNYAFFGDEQMERVRGAFVIVIGVGGVGSHAALHLLRSGRSCGLRVRTNTCSIHTSRMSVIALALIV